MDPGHIKAVTFDAGGTLIEPWPSVGDVYARVAAEFGHSLAPAKLNAAFSSAWKRRKEFDYSLPSWRHLVEQVFVLATPLPSALFDSLYQRFAEAGAWRIHSDVTETLQALRQRGYRMAVISNWDERLKALLANLRLNDYFEAIVVSVDVGATKPAPEIFKRALQLLNLAPVEVLHIGDSIEEDFAGAHDCGLSALLLDRSGKSKEALPSLENLLSLLH